MEQSLVAYSDIERMGSTIAKSGLFGVKTVEQAVALMLIAQAEGKHPATAAQEYHVIQGRASLKADQMLARFQNAGGSIKWIKRTDSEASAEFSHPQGGTLVVSWTMERAKKAELSGKDNWKKYPAQMLSARVISEGVRAVFPAACGSFYTPEEVQDFTPIQKEPEQAAVVIEEKTEPKKSKATQAEKTAVAEAVARVQEVVSAPKPDPVTGPPAFDVLTSRLTDIQLSGTAQELDAWAQDVLNAGAALTEKQRAELRTEYKRTKTAITARTKTKEAA